MTDGLFDMEPAPLHPGDKVTVQTMWGIEAGTVTGVTHEDGFPMVELDLENGDTITIDVARCKRHES